MRASAFIVGSGEEAVSALEALAAGLGFAPVTRYTGMNAARVQVDETPLVFFLCAPVKEVEELKLIQPDGTMIIPLNTADRNPPEA